MLHSIRSFINQNYSRCLFFILHHKRTLFLFLQSQNLLSPNNRFFLFLSRQRLLYLLQTTIVFLFPRENDCIFSPQTTVFYITPQISTYFMYHHSGIFNVSLDNTDALNVSLNNGYFLFLLWQLLFCIFPDNSFGGTAVVSFLPKQ